MKKFPQKLLVSQYLFESEGWERLLRYLQQEIIAYKSRLAELIEYADEEVLLAAEKFQDEFLAQDRVFRFLSGELHMQLGLLNKDGSFDDNHFGMIMLNQKKIRSDIQKANILFSKVKNGFARYLSKLF